VSVGAERLKVSSTDGVCENFPGDLAAIFLELELNCDSFEWTSVLAAEIAESPASGTPLSRLDTISHNNTPPMTAIMAAAVSGGNILPISAGGVGLIIPHANKPGEGKRSRSSARRVTQFSVGAKRLSLLVRERQGSG
jgi:hypothetical protein